MDFKKIFVLWFISRLIIVLALLFIADSPCSIADCQNYWNNVQYTISGENMYKIWSERGLDSSGVPLYQDIPYQASFPPFFYFIISPFALIWESPWAMRLIFFIADFFNLLLIYSLSKNKLATLGYLFIPIVWISGLIIPQDEIIVVTFLLASLYLYKNKHYSLSVLSLALATNLKIFPIVLLPLFILLAKRDNKKLIDLVKYMVIFILTTILLHIPYYPYWKVAYAIRIAELGHQSIWLLLPYSQELRLIVVVSAFMLFYAYSYIKKLDLTVNYLLGSLIFITFYPSLTFEHLIIIASLFLIFAEYNNQNIFFYLIFSLITLFTTPVLPISVSYDLWIWLMLITLLLFFIIIINQIANNNPFISLYKLFHPYCWMCQDDVYSKNSCVSCDFRNHRRKF